MSTIGTTSNGSTFISGTASGIDTTALIQAAVNAKLTKATRLDDSISTNTSKISAYQQLQTNAQKALDALNTLKNGGSAFGAKQVTGKASDGTDGSAILTADASTNASSGTYRVVVQQLAQSLTVTSAAQSSATAALGLSGNFTLALDGLGGASITITAGMSLTDIAGAINAASGGSGVKADLLQTGGGAKLVLTGTDTAKSFSITNVSGTDIMQSLGITKADGSFANVSQQAQQAIVTLNGTTINSDSNTLSNVLGGLTLHLENAAPSTTVTLTVGNNSDGIKDAINDFITAYNTLRDFLAQQQQITNGAVSSSAYLYGESVARNMMQSLSSMVTQSYGTSGYNSLGAIGVSLDESNHLVLDEDKLDNALKDHFSDVQAMFGTASGGGMADALSKMLDGYADENKGSIASRITELQSVNSDLTTQSNAIKDQAKTYQDQLVQKYAAMEAKIQSANILKQQIEAIMNGANNDNSN